MHLTSDDSWSRGTRSGLTLTLALALALALAPTWSRKIMPMRETVAGEANLRSCVSKMKLT